MTTISINLKLTRLRSEIESEFKTLIQNYGAKILSVTRIIRSEMESPNILKNADFSTTVKKLISLGEKRPLKK